MLKLKALCRALALGLCLLMALSAAAGCSEAGENTLTDVHPGIVQYALPQAVE